jgi:hypothetical protein
MMDIPLNQKLYSRIMRRMTVRNFVSSLGIIPHGSLSCVIFKEQLTSDMIKKMKNLGFITIQLPANPYLA